MKVDLERELARLILHCARGCTVHSGSGVGVAPGHCALAATLSYSTEAIIRRPLEDVFDFCSDLRNELTWNPNARSVTKPTDQCTGGCRHTIFGTVVRHGTNYRRCRSVRTPWHVGVTVQREGDARANPRHAFAVPVQQPSFQEHVAARPSVSRSSFVHPARGDARMPAAGARDAPNQQKNERVSGDELGRTSLH
jgi:hypothetical protein